MANGQNAPSCDPLSNLHKLYTAVIMLSIPYFPLHMSICLDVFKQIFCRKYLPHDTIQKPPSLKALSIRDLQLYHAVQKHHYQQKVPNRRSDNHVICNFDLIIPTSHSI